MTPADKNPSQPDPFINLWGDHQDEQAAKPDNSTRESENAVKEQNKERDKEFEDELNESSDDIASKNYDPKTFMPKKHQSNQGVTEFSDDVMQTYQPPDDKFKF